MGALEGLRILDMTQYEAGTSATQAMAWMGAEVVKVESPRGGDPGRAVGTGDNYAPYFCNWNANKKSLTLDLSKPEGHALLLQLLPRFDVFVENYGPGVVERLDITYERVREVHPSIIYAQVKGFGNSGPYAGFKSYDMVAQAAAGAFSVTGYPDGTPTCPGPTTGDSGTGMQLGMAILAAYIQRMRTGEGQRIEVSMQEAMTYFMRTRISFAGDWGNQAVPRTGNGLGPPTELYPCKPLESDNQGSNEPGPNDYAYLIVVTAQHWDALCLAIERPDLITDQRFEDGLGRLQNGAALYEEIAKWTRERTKHEVMSHLGAAGVPCSAVLDTKDLYDDPHLNERGFVHSIEHPQHGTVRLLGWAPRMSGSPTEITPAPELGEHSEEVLTAELGIDAAAIQELRSKGILA